MSALKWVWLVVCVALVSVARASTELAADGGSIIDLGSPAEPLPASDPAAEVSTRVTLDARFGEGVTLRAGPLKVTVRGRIQGRADALVPVAGSSAQRVNELLIRRARLVFTALYGDDWKLYTQLGFAALDMEPDAPNILRDAYLTWQHFRDVNIRVGQAKVLFGRQRVTSSSALQMPDRSIVIAELNLDRDVGVTAMSEDLFGLGGRLQYALGVNGGDGRNRVGTNLGLLYFARLQVNPLGKFDDLVEGDLQRSDRLRLAFGVSGAVNAHTVRQRSTTSTTWKHGDTTYSHAGADALLKWRGLSLQAEVLTRKASVENIGGAGSSEWARSAWGYFVQAGYVPLNAFEVSARWGQLRPFAGTDPSFKQQRELGAGLSWYPEKHNLKIQGDYFWISSGNDFTVGYHQVRVQMQAYF